MPDFYGISAAVKACLEMYERASRGTGRTTNLIQSLQEGDLVIFPTVPAAKHAEKTARKYGVVLKYTVIDPAHPDWSRAHGRAKRRAIFSHEWVEEYYRMKIHNAAESLRHIQDDLSGAPPDEAPTKLWPLHWEG